MLEEIILLETSKALSKNKEVFKYKFDNGGEFDVVVYDKMSNTCSIYEVKHSNKIINNQYTYLVDANKCNLLEKIYGKISNKYVIYTGNNAIVDGINYINVEEYLLNI